MVVCFGFIWVPGVLGSPHRRAFDVSGERNCGSRRRWREGQPYKTLSNFSQSSRRKFILN